LRDLLRYRRRLIEGRTAERNRLSKLLETANIKLATVVTDVFGVSGRLMLQALIEGRAKPPEMAALARGVLRRNVGDLEQALDGRFEDNHRFLRVVAAVIVAERGLAMTVSRSAKHAAAWAGVCPGNNESAGKHSPASARRGDVRLRTALVEAAVATSRKKESYFRDKFHRLRARPGRQTSRDGHRT